MFSWLKRQKPEETRQVCTDSTQVAQWVSPQTVAEMGLMLGRIPDNSTVTLPTRSGKISQIVTRDGKSVVRSVSFEKYEEALTLIYRMLAPISGPERLQLIREAQSLLEREGVSKIVPPK